MSVVCRICANKAVFSVPRHSGAIAHYCAAHVPAVYKEKANIGAFPLIAPTEEVEVEVAAPKKKAAKPAPVVEEPTLFEDAPVEEVATPEEIAVESTDEDN